MAGVLRGDVYWADLDPVRGHEQGGQRPVLVVSHDIFNERSGTVIAMAITSQPQRAGFPLTWKPPTKLARRDAWIKISQLRTLSTQRLGKRIGHLGSDQLSHIIDGLLELVG
jgi:mRNA interferase MazF